MKRIFILILISVLLVMSFASCGKEDKDAAIKNNLGDGLGNTDSNGADSNGDGKSDGDTVESTSVDYLNDDLSEYISIDEKYYKDYIVTLDHDKVTFYAENSIIQMLCEYKNKESVEGDGIVSVGDVVDIYYKGYYMSGDKKVYFNGGSNEGTGNPYTLEIGSGGFIPGFEYNLIGVKAADYSNTPVVVETYFPKNYREPSLAGVTAYFEVRIIALTEYDAPVLDDAFITDKLEITLEDLAEFEGDSLSDKFRAYTKEKAMYDNGLDSQTLTSEALQASILNGVVVKKLPSFDVDGIYEAIISDIDAMYQYYQYYYTYDQLAALYLSQYYGLNVGDDWKTDLRAYAEKQVTYMLAIFYIIDKENLVPTEEEYNALFDEYFLEALTEAGITADKYQTEAEYKNACEKYKAQMIENNGEDYFKKLIYYSYAHEKLMSYASIV